MSLALKQINILMATAETAPLAKVGGLGDVLGALPKALAKNKLAVKVILPFYGSIDVTKYPSRLVKKGISFEFNHQKQKFDLYQTNLPGSKVPVYLIKHPLFNGKFIYAPVEKSASDIERYTFFSQAVVATIYDLAWSIDIIHCHDWHTALIPSYVDDYSLKHRNFANIKTILTIHNLASQGLAELDILDYAALDKTINPAILEDYYDQDNNKIDLLKIGILSADFITTVSPSYAQEILSKQYGCGLETYLQRRHKHLLGILNGIDTDIFNPQTDKYLVKKYSAKSFLEGKQANKKYLQKKFKLPVLSQPLFGIVTRLVEQKGFDILLPALEKFLKDHNVQVVILGTGHKIIENKLQALAKLYPNKLSVYLGFDLALAQIIYGASDFFLMPSYFEPCGLGQMIAMRYGSLPIVRSVGGLKDTVVNDKNGLAFNNYQVDFLLNALERAVKLYANQARLNKMIKVAMATDWSWDLSAQKYIKLYKKIK